MGDEVLKTNGSNRVNKFPLSSQQSIFLVMSSCSFILPCAYALVFRAYHHSTTSFLTSLISINYWRYAVPGIRKNCDLFFAKLSFAVFFITGCVCVRDPLLLVIGWSIFPGIVYAYYKSNDEWAKDNNTWVYFHMLFHFLIAFEQTLIIIGTFALQ